MKPLSIIRNVALVAMLLSLNPVDAKANGCATTSNGCQVCWLDEGPGGGTCSAVFCEVGGGIGFCSECITPDRVVCEFPRN